MLGVEDDAPDGKDEVRQTRWIDHARDGVVTFAAAILGGFAIHNRSLVGVELSVCVDTGDHVMLSVANVGAGRPLDVDRPL